MPRRGKSLIIVHAGSFFASADFNLDPTEAELRREYFYETLVNWRGPMVRTVTEIDQDVEGEAHIHRALADLLLKIETVGEIDQELHDLSFLWDSKEATRRLGLRPSQVVWVTGGWYGRTGCVNETARSLQTLGYKPKIHDSALPELFWGQKRFNRYVGRMSGDTWKPRPAGMRLRWE